MKSDIHKHRIPVVPLGNPFPPRHCSLCPKGAAIDRDNQHRLIDKRRRFKSGEILARQDEAANMLFVIHEGTASPAWNAVITILSVAFMFREISWRWMLSKGGST